MNYGKDTENWKKKKQYKPIKQKWREEKVATKNTYNIKYTQKLYTRPTNAMSETDKRHNN